MRWWLGLAVLVLGAAAFFAGRASVGRPTGPSSAFSAGYLAGREAAFAGFDGGWAYETPYAVVLERGGAGITYRVAHRVPLARGVSYRVCGRSVCAVPTH